LNEAPALRIEPEFLSDAALRKVMAVLPDSRVVGGAVRDALAGRPVADIDLATSALPDDVVRVLSAAGIRAVPTGIQHGTVTAVLDGGNFEVTTLRRDIETDGRRASVAFTDDWRVDAARRDFTMNAMSLNEHGEVFDYFGGIADLQAGIVRFVGDPRTRIAEDYLRILRYFRFHARYGAGAPDPAALAAIRASVDGLAILSVERVWSELQRILTASDPVGAVALMDELGVLPAVLPEGADPSRLAQLAAADAPADPLLRLAALLTGNAEALAGRLRLSGDESDRLIALRNAPALPATADDDALRRALADTAPDILIGRAWLAGSPATLRARLAAIPPPRFALEGRDALALGVPPGPAVGALLRGVRDWWLTGGCRADASACRAELARRIGG
jgi:poly(A) polymerase